MRGKTNFLYESADGRTYQVKPTSHGELGIFRRSDAGNMLYIRLVAHEKELAQLKAKTIKESSAPKSKPAKAKKKTKIK